MYLTWKYSSNITPLGSLRHHASGKLLCKNKKIFIGIHAYVLILLLRSSNQNETSIIRSQRVTDPAKFTVDHNAVASHIDQLRGYSVELEQESTHFLNVIEPLRGQWKGSSFESWDTMTARWHELISVIDDTLQQFTGRMDTAGNIYQTGDADQTQQIQNRFSGMDMPSGDML